MEEEPKHILVQFFEFVFVLLLVAFVGGMISGFLSN